MFAPSPLNELTEGSADSLADDLDQYPLAPPPVELAVEDSFPRSEVQLSVCYGNNRFPPHDRSLQMRVGIIFAVVMSILGDRLVRGQLFKPNVQIMMKPGFIVINKNGRRDVHRNYEDEPFLNTAFLETFFHLPGNVYESPPRTSVEPKLFPITFHPSTSLGCNHYLVFLRENWYLHNLIFLGYLKLMTGFPSFLPEDVVAGSLHCSGHLGVDCFTARLSWKDRLMFGLEFMNYGLPGSS